MLKMYFLILFVLCGCVNKNKAYLIEINKTRVIKLDENIKKIGFLSSISVSNKEHLYILDEISHLITEYSPDGKYITSYGGKGRGPLELEEPTEFCLDSMNENLFVVEGMIGIKKINIKSNEVKKITFSDDQFLFVHGNLTIINSDSIVLTSFWKTKDINTNLIIIDQNGIIIKTYEFLPDDYEKYSFGKENWHAINSKNDFVVTFLKSPDLFIGNILSGSIRKIELPVPLNKYISEKRKYKMSLQESIKINREERMNYRVDFLNDTVIVRATHINTEKSSQIRSFVQRAEQRVELISINGEYIGEIPINGALRCVYNQQLVVEESDEPDKRLISFYSVNLIEK